VDLAIAFYRNQRAGTKLLTLASTSLSDYDAGWAVVDRHQLDVQVGGASLQVIEKRLQSSGTSAQNLLAWQWYWIDGLETNSVWRAKLAQVQGKASGAGDSAAGIVLLTPYADNLLSTRETLIGFMSQMRPAIDQRLRHATDQ